jgi:hypothetical protein
MGAVGEGADEGRVQTEQDQLSARVSTLAASAITVRKSSM